MKVSIILPAYNAEAYVEEAICSVLAQSYAAWELIVIDDGSTDNTAKLVGNFVDPRIKFIRQKNQGVSAARNAGLDCAVGQYVTFMDSDDVLPPDALFLRAACLDMHPQVDIVNGAVRITSQGCYVRQYVPSMKIGPLFPRLARLEEGVFFGPFYMLRRALIKAYRFPVGISHCEDLIFFITLAHDVGLHYGSVDGVVYEYRIRNGSAMSDIHGIENGYLELIRHATSLCCLSKTDYKCLKRRIAYIMIKSWVRRGRLLRALNISRKIATIRQKII